MRPFQTIHSPAGGSSTLPPDAAIRESRAAIAVQAVQISLDRISLTGDLIVPTGAVGVVAFAHGSGSSRLSPRNRSVAGKMQAAGLATLLFDLLSPDEEMEDAYDGHLRFNIELLALRLVHATRWLAQQPATAQLGLGYFGASTGGAAALVAAAEVGPLVQAVVSRGGRPDLAGEAIDRVIAPTQLIVGERDEFVLQLNQEAFARLRCEKRLSIVPGATHLFDEPGAIEEVASLAATWFRQHLKLK